MNFLSYTDHSHWKDFYSPKDARDIESTVKEIWIESTGTHIHLDLYEQPENAPTIIFCHGLASCGRIMGHIAMGLHQQGFNVICPDLVGFGLTTKKHGSGTISVFIQNILDTLSFAQERYKTPLYLAGISMGGILSYYTACVSPHEIKAIACYCLLDLSERKTKKISKTGSNHVSLMTLLAKLGATFIPNTYIPLRKFLTLDTLSNNEKLNMLFRDNPLCVKKYTFKSAHSIITSAPQIPFEQFHKTSVLVIHAENDRMVPEKLSRMNYERLHCPKKYHLIKDCEHVPVDYQHLKEYIDVMVEWFGGKNQKKAIKRQEF